MESLTVAVLAARVAGDRKARDVVVLDMREVTLVADYFVIAGVPTAVQARAVADHIAEELREQGVGVRHREGRGAGTWILLDYGSVIVHVFREEERKFFALERLWSDATVVAVEDVG